MYTVLPRYIKIILETHKQFRDFKIMYSMQIPIQCNYQLDLTSVTFYVQQENITIR